MYKTYEQRQRRLNRECRQRLSEDGLPSLLIDSVTETATWAAEPSSASYESPSVDFGGGDSGGGGSSDSFGGD